MRYAFGDTRGVRISMMITLRCVCMHSQFFLKFKLALVNAEADPMVMSENGLERPLLDVVVQTLEYTKSQSLANLKKTLGDLLDTDAVTWVITLPAIWTDFAKVSAPSSLPMP